MLTNKEKRYLKALGASLEPVVQIGKAGVAPAVVDGAAGVIAGRELIKVRVLKNSPEEPGEAIARLAEGVGAELVQVIGRNGLLFKRNPEKPKIEFPVAVAAPAPAAKPVPPPETRTPAKPRGVRKPAPERALAPKPRTAGKPGGRPPLSVDEKPAGPKTRGAARPSAGKAFAPKPAAGKAFAPKPRGTGKPSGRPARPDGERPAKPRGAAGPAAERAFGPKPRGAGKPVPGLRRDGREAHAYQAEPGRGQSDRRQGGYKYVDPQHRQTKSAGNRKTGAGTVRPGQPGKTDTAGHVRSGGRGHGPAGAKRKT